MKHTEAVSLKKSLATVSELCVTGHEKRNIRSNTVCDLPEIRIIPQARRFWKMGAEFRN